MHIDLRIHLDLDFSQDSFLRMMLAFIITHLGDNIMLQRRKAMRVLSWTICGTPSALAQPDAPHEQICKGRAE